MIKSDLTEIKREKNYYLNIDNIIITKFYIPLYF